MAERMDMKPQKPVGDTKLCELLDMMEPLVPKRTVGGRKRRVDAPFIAVIKSARCSALCSEDAG